MRGIISYFIKYPVAGNLLMILILIFGYFGSQQIKSTFFPQAVSRVIEIRTFYPGASPDEIEEGIVTKIEDNLKGVTGIFETRSVSSENQAVITVEGERGYDVDNLLQDVKNAVDQISSFPVGMESPVVFKQESRNFVISFALTGDVDLQTLKYEARKVEDDLRAMDGISKISLGGFPEEEIEIALDEEALEGYDLTFEAVSVAVANANIEITGGRIKTSREEFLIRARSKEYYATELADIIVKASSDGTIVRLSDIAEVRDIWSDNNPQRNFFNGDPAATVTVQNTNDEDFLTISADVKEYIEAFNEVHDVVKAKIIRDGSTTLVERIELLQNNGILGFFLVVLFLTLILNWRLAIWVALSIPVAFAGMFILGSAFGLTINVLSLFGMILVVGILVDDGIVISENIYQKWEKGETPLKAAVEGTMEVLPAVTSAVLTTIIAFSTFYFLDGRLGDFGPDLAFVVISTLLFSLIEGALILPAHVGHSAALRKGTKKNRFERGAESVVFWLREKLYMPFLRFSLKHTLIAFAIPTALFMITIGGIAGGIIKVTFFPFIEQDNVSVSVETPPGTRDYITMDVLNKIEAAAKLVNDRYKAEREDGKDVITNIEKVLGPSINKGQVNIQFLTAEERDIPSYLISNAISDEVGQIPEAEKIAFGIATPFGKPISVSLRGSNLDELEMAKNELKQELAQIADLKDVVDNDQQGIKEIEITMLDKGRMLGLNTIQVMRQVRQAFFGAEAQRLQRGIDEVKVWVRYNEEGRSTIEELEDYLIRTPSGQKIPLKEVAEFSVQRGIVAINHLDGKRDVRVEADIANPEVSVNTVQADISDNIMPKILSKYASVDFSFEGQNKEAQKVGNSFAKVRWIILILLIAVTAFVFRSIPQALVIMMMIPLGLIGVGWGHFFHNAQISLLSGFGIIALIGVMVNDSLVFVTALNNNLKSGMLFQSALIEAGRSRFRPILLTTLTTVAGLAPLIFETSFQAQFLVPMAIAVAYGLIIATYTTLLVLPVMLALLNKIRLYLDWFWKGKRPLPREVEPAIQELKSEQEFRDHHE
ncbi:MAG: efflux RND transporter permease subunit [Flavobacteriales bacterium]|nr:efflux RND transporter permease subunit [Flavobacteriales bacterium]